MGWSLWFGGDVLVVHVRDVLGSGATDVGDAVDDGSDGVGDVLERGEGEGGGGGGGGGCGGGRGWKVGRGVSGVLLGLQTARQGFVVSLLEMARVHVDGRVGCEQIFDSALDGIVVGFQGGA